MPRDLSPQFTVGCRETPIPYGRQSIAEEDIAAVVEVLRSDWLTTGPKVAQFERAMAEFVGTREAIALSSGTAALHAAMFALGIGPGDEVIVPAMTFAATANCVVYQGGSPVFADVDPETLLVDVDDVARKLSPRTRAIIAVDFAGQPCDYRHNSPLLGHDSPPLGLDRPPLGLDRPPFRRLEELATANGRPLVADASHSLGALLGDRRAGSLADLTTFSFHPVKPLTTGEGGMVTTDDAGLANRIRSFRNHGIDCDHRERQSQGAWFYRMTELGYNYRLSDMQCALGLSQLKRLPEWVRRRQEIAARYDAAFAEIDGLDPLTVREDVSHAYHLYVIRVDPLRAGITRDELFRLLRDDGIGVNVHYVPVHLHPYYRDRFGTGPGLCPAAESAFERILTLPLFASMTDGDVDRVIAAVSNVRDEG